MALDRQSIVKRDFPIGRRGYEPRAVDQHLATLADEVEALHRSAGRSTATESLATAAAERVRLIVEAAEQGAAEIVGEAEAEARQILQDGREAAEAARAEATRQAHEHVDRVSETTNVMLQRADALEGEFQGLLESVRSSAARLSQELQGLQTTVGELRATTGAPAPSNGSGAYTLSGDPGPAPHGDPVFGAPDKAAPVRPDEESEEPQLDPDPSARGVGDDQGGDEEGARLIALNMALNGTPREETERYLADHFGLADTQALLDDVYARAGQ